MTTVTATYESDDAEISFTATRCRPYSDEEQISLNNIEVEEARIFGVIVTQADVSPALWTAIEGRADFVEFDE
jgi:hypothetical protein